MKHKLLATFAMAMAATAMQAQTVAFPGAEGFGAWATGGRDSRKVVHVTNLNADGLAHWPKHSTAVTASSSSTSEASSNSIPHRW